MDGISWLLQRLGLVPLKSVRAQGFENQELRKKCVNLEDAYERHCKELIKLEASLEKSFDEGAKLEQEAMASEEAKVLAVAQLEGLREEVTYLKGQVVIYQARLGLLPQEPRAQQIGEQKILRKARVPFAVAEARIQTQRTEEYWKNRAKLADVGGVEAVTSPETK